MLNKAKTLQAWYDDVWTDGDIGAIPRFLASDAKSSGILPDMALAPTDLAELVALIRSEVGPIEVKLAKVVDCDDWISALIEVRSHVPETGDPIHVFGQVMARFEEDRMTEIYNSFDFLSFFEQVGQLPSNALAVLLSGTKLQ